MLTTAATEALHSLDIHDLCGFRIPDKAYLWSAETGASPDAAAALVDVYGGGAVFEVIVVPAGDAPALAEAWAKAFESGLPNAERIEEGAVALVGHWVTGGEADIVACLVAYDAGYLIPQFSAEEPATYVAFAGNDNEWVTIFEGLGNDGDIYLPVSNVIRALMAAANPAHVAEFLDEDQIATVVNDLDETVPEADEAGEVDLEQELREWLNGCREQAKLAPSD